MLKALFIDFDGTVVDTLPLLYQAYIEGLAQLQCKSTREEFELLNGITVHEILRYLAARYGWDSQQIEIFSTFYRQTAQRLVIEQVRSFPGVERVLDFAREKEWGLFLVTSSSPEWVLPILRRLNLQHVFDHIVSADAHTRGKPHPDLYLQALEIAECDPREGLVIEDAEKGVQAAIQAGIPVISFDRPLDLQGVVKNCQNWKEIHQYLLQEAAHGFPSV